MNLKKTLKYFRRQEQQSGKLLLDAVCSVQRQKEQL
jgi:hypothetical protein